MNKVSTKVWIILWMLMILIFAGSYLLDIPLKDVFFKSNIQEETKEIQQITPPVFQKFQEITD